MTLVLIIFGIYILSQNVSELEAQKNYFDNMTISEQIEFKDNIANRTVILDGLDIEQERKDQIYDALQLVTFDPTEDGKEAMVIKAAANSAFKDKATASMRLGLRIAITIFPVLLIFISYWLINKKYIINEEYYENMVVEIREKLKKSDEVEIIV